MMHQIIDLLDKFVANEAGMGARSRNVKFNEKGRKNEKKKIVEKRGKISSYR